jgi:hypothetical protein
MPMAKKKPVKRGPKDGKKHTPGRDHDRKSKANKRKREQKKRERLRKQELERCKDQWVQWLGFDDFQKRMRPDLTPDCPRPPDV